jgi:hypothetical protein
LTGATAAKGLDAIRAELDLCVDAGVRVPVWVRDDDAVADTPRLRQLLDIARGHDLVVALGVIPGKTEASLVRLIESEAACCVWQHGWVHDFHRHGEFGRGRTLDPMIEDALKGQRAMDALFGADGWQRVFVPPNHRITPDFKRLAPALGYWGVSAGEGGIAPIDGVAEVNADVDLMLWKKGRLRSADDLGLAIGKQVSDRRTGRLPASSPLGILTHHLVFDADAMRFVAGLCGLLLSHPAVYGVGADQLFAPPGALQSSAVEGDVTVVITSCGRPDLLGRTLESFTRQNTHPVRRILVMEDGPEPAPLPGLQHDARISWLSTGGRIGQVAAIDLAYHAVETEYIFHCEDDWEFVAPGFLEKSLAVLESNPFILQVWLRSLADTNGHPVLEGDLTASDARFRLLSPHYDARAYGIWRGFSWNPGLRRRRDYRLHGSFKAWDPRGDKASYDVERAASDFYFGKGFLAAILSDNDGKGYVRHSGDGRRVTSPTDRRRLRMPAWLGGRA